MRPLIGWMRAHIRQLEPFSSFLVTRLPSHARGVSGAAEAAEGRAETSPAVSSAVAPAARTRVSVLVRIGLLSLLTA